MPGLLLLLVVVHASLVWAQESVPPAKGAGVVTNVVGQATVARRIIPQPLPLKFKDDVFVGDNIKTAKQSLARLLLGGKAVVTVRELSELMVSEEAGRSLIDFNNGRLAVNVERERMRPGEVLLIRTPNAIAAVRGTMLIVDVIRSLSLFGDPQILTTVYVLEGEVEIETRAALGKTTTVKTSQSLTITQDQIGSLTPISNLAAAYEVLKTPYHHTDVPQRTKTQIDDKQEGQAVALSEVIAPAPGGQGAPAPIQPTTQAGTPIVSTTPNTGGPNVTPGSASQSNVTINQTTVTPSNAFTFTTSGNQITIDQGQSAKTYDGTTTDSSAVPAVQVTNANVNQAGSDPFISVPQGANATTDGPVLAVSNSSVTPGTNVLSVQGILTSTSTNPLISLDPTTITTSVPNDLIHIAGGTIATGGPLLADQGGTLTIGGAVVGLSKGGALSNGAGPLVQLTGSTLAASAFISTDGQGNQLNLTGTLLDMTNATATLGAVLATSGTDTVNHALVPGQPDIQLTTSQLALTGNGALMGTIAVGTGSTLEFRSGTQTSTANIVGPGTVLFSGATVNLNGGTYNITGTSTQVTGGTANFNPGVTLTSLGPLTITGGTLNLNSGEPITLSALTLQGSATFGGTDLVTVTGPTTKDGVGTTTTIAQAVTTTGSVTVNNGTLALTGGGTHSGDFTGAGTLELAGGHTFGATSDITVSNVVFSGGTTNVGGTYVLSGSSTTITGGTVNFTHPSNKTVGALTISGDGIANFSGTPGGPFTINATTLDLSGTGTLTGSDNLTASGALTWTGGTMSGSGTTTVNGVATLNGNSTKTLNRTLTLVGGGSLAQGTLSGTGGLVVTGGSVSVPTGNVYRLAGTTTLTGGAITLINADLVALGTGETFAPVSQMVAVIGGSLTTSGEGSDLVELSGTGTLNAGGSVLTVGGTGNVNLAGSVANLLGSTLTTPVGVNLVTVTGGSLTVGSALLNLASSTSTAMIGGDVLNQTGGTVTGPSLGIVTMAAGTLTVAGDVADLNGGTLTLNAPVLAATGGTVTTGGGIRALNSTLNVSTSAPLFAASNAASVTVNGSALDLTNTSLNLGTQAFSTFSGGSTLTNNTTTAVFKITGGSFTADTLLIMSGATPNHLIRTGPLFDLTNATVALRSITDFTPATDTISITLGPGQANVRLTDSNFTLTGAGEPFSALGGLNVAPLTHPGVALIATNTGGAAETITIAGPLAMFTNGVTLTDTAAQIQLTGMTVNQSGTNGLIELPASVAASIAGPLVSTVTSTLDLSSARHLLFLDNGASLTATGAGVGPLLGVSGGSVTTGQELIVLHPGSTLTLNRTFLSAANTVITSGADFPLIAVDSGATLSVGGHLFDLTNTNLDLTFGGSPDQPLVRLSGVSTLTLGGSFLKMNGGTVTVDQFLLGGGQDSLVINSTSPFVDLTNATVTTTGSAVTSGDNPTAILGTGVPVVKLDNSQLTFAGGNLDLCAGAACLFGPSTGALALVATNGSTLTQNEGGLVEFSGGAAATTTAIVPLIQLTASTLNLNGESQHALVRARDAGTAGVFNGPFLAATNSTINLNGDANLLWVDDGVSLTRTGAGTGATFQFTGGTLNVTEETVLIRPGATLSQNNPLLSATGTTFNLGTDGAFTDAALTITALGGVGGTLTSTTTNPLFSFNGGGLTTQAGEDLVRIGRNPGDGVASMTLAGPVLKLQNITSGNFSVGSGTLFHVSGGSTLSAAGSFLDATDSVLSFSSPMLRLVDGSTATNQAGPRVKVTGGSLTAKALARFEGVGNVNTFTGPLLELTNTTVTLNLVAEFGPGASVAITRNLTAGQPFVSLTNSTLSLTNPTAAAGIALVAFGNPNATPMNQAGVALSAVGPASVINLTTSSLLGLFGGATSVTYTDPASSLVQLANTTVTQTGTGAPLVDVGGSVTVQSTAALLSVANSTINSTGTTTAAGLLRVQGGATFTLNGPLLTTNPSTLSLSGALLVMVGGTLVSNTTSPFFDFVGGALNLGLRGVFLTPGSQATLQGPLFRANGTVIASGLVTPVPFIELNRTAAPTSLTVGGSLLDLTNTTLNLLYGPGTGDDQAVVRLTGGSAIASTVGPTIRVSNSSILADALFATDGASNSGTIRGSFLDLSNNAAVTVRRIANQPPGDTDTFTVTLAADQPFYAVTNSTLTTTQGNGGLCVGCGDQANPFPGRVLVATNSTITFGTSGLFSFEGNVTSSTTSTLGLVVLTNSTVNLTDPVNSTAFAASFGLNTKGTLGGPLFVMNAASALNIANGVLLEVTTGATLEVIGNGRLGQFLDSASRLNVTHSLACSGNCVDLPNTSFKILVTNGGATLLDPAYQPFVVSDGALDNEIRVNNGVGDQILIRVDGNGSTLQLSAAAASALVIPPDQTINTNQAFSSAQHGLAGAGGILDGTGTVFVQGLYQWESGTMQGTGTTAAQGGLTLGGNVTLNRALLLAGTSQILGNFTIAGTGTLSNAGTLTKTAGAGTATINPLFNNTGTVNVNAGSLVLAGGGTSNGTMTIAGGTTLGFGGGSHNLNAGSLISGAGTVQVTGGTVNLNVSGVNRLTGTLNVSGGTLTANGDVIALGTGETLAPSGTAIDVGGGGNLALVSASNDVVHLTGTATLTAGGTVLLMGGASATVGGHVLHVGGGTATGPAGGNVIAVAAGNFDTVGSLVKVTPGGSVIVPSTAAVASINGGTLGNPQSLATGTGAAMFDLAGDPTHTTNETVNLGALGTADVTVGTDRPIRGSGTCPSCQLQASMLETPGTTTVISGGRVLKISTALLEASLPLLNLKAGATLTLSANALDLPLQTKLISMGPQFVKIDGATLTINVGALANIAGGSFLSILGDFLNLSNTATLRLNDVNDGFLLKASGGSVVQIEKGLVNFETGVNNLVEIKNNKAPSFTTPNGIKFFFTGGATSAQVEVLGTPIKSPGQGSITFPNSGSHILVEGTATRVQIKGN